ncbi:MAG: serine hydrolase domain-containing protein [Chloroflexota bacterium]
MNSRLVDDALAYADQWLAYQQQLKEIPALTFAVRLGDEPLVARAYGFANLQEQSPAEPESIFRVASHSKWFTATAIMKLVEQGKLRLDDRLVQFILWLQPPVADVTIREVLNHAAGITRDGFQNDHWQLEDPFPDVGQLRSLVEQNGSVLPANQKLKYSNIGFSLLGLVIEAVSGRPYNQFVQEEIVEPLGLENTGPETTAEAQERLVTGYTSRNLLTERIPLPDANTGAMSPATGFYSTAPDLTRFAQAHFLGNEELVSDASKREMQRPYWIVEDMDSYGLGMQVTKIGERRMVGHSGGFPGHITRTLLDPEDRLAISVLTSDSSGPASDMVKSIVKLVDLALAQSVPEHPDDLDSYTGRFVSLGGYADIVRLGNQLFLMGPDSDSPADDAVKVEVLDENTLLIEEKEGYGSPGEKVVFQRGDDGGTEKVVIAGSAMYPAEIAGEYLRRRRQEFAAKAAGS